MASNSPYAFQRFNGLVNGGSTLMFATEGGNLSLTGKPLVSPVSDPEIQNTVTFIRKSGSTNGPRPTVGPLDTGGSGGGQPGTDPFSQLVGLAGSILTGGSGGGGSQAQPVIIPGSSSSGGSSLALLALLAGAALLIYYFISKRKG